MPFEPDLLTKLRSRCRQLVPDMDAVTAVLLLAGLLQALAGCGVAGKVEARHHLEDAQEAYAGCLHTNTAAPDTCRTAKLELDSRLRTYDHLAAGVTIRGVNVNDASLEEPQ